MNHALSDFDFTLPEELIAQAPAHPRDTLRLLVYNRDVERNLLAFYFQNNS